MYRKTLFAVLAVFILSVTAIPAMAQEPAAADSIGSTVYLPVVSTGEPTVYRELKSDIRAWHSYADFICFDYYYGCDPHVWHAGNWVTVKPYYFLGIQVGWWVALIDDEPPYEDPDWHYTNKYPDYVGG